MCLPWYTLDQLLSLLQLLLSVLGHGVRGIKDSLPVDLRLAVTNLDVGLGLSVLLVGDRPEVMLAAQLALIQREILGLYHV